MDPTREPRSTAAEPTAARDILPDDAVVAYLRTRAPGLPAARFDARAITSRARGALRRRRRNSVLAAAGAATVCLALMLAGPLSVPGLGTVSVPGGEAIRALGDLVPGRAPGFDQRHADVDRLETEVLPAVEELEVSYYLLEPGPCRILEYPRGNYRDGAPECQDLVPFDAEARADFGEVTDAVERSGVAVERIFREAGGIYVQIEEHSWRYNWEYVYLPDVGSPPATTGPGEEWTHIRDDWWFHRAQDD
ncbi:hypothetical protein AAH979_42260 [Plantactinospora sp. ZYX-F-223]|uniref:hypothetical protein n=1 Tax=Plantactinospora sp. ZYX-F-223 TaxID=3144103 RepID=UPI0031FC0402